MSTTAGAIRSGRAFVELFTVDNMTAGLMAAQAKLRAFAAAWQSTAQSMIAFGIGLGAPLFLAARHFANAGSAVNDMAERLGIGTEALQELTFAFEQTGGTAEDLERALQFMRRGGFGRTAEDFIRLAEGVAAIEDPIARTQRGMDIFGRGVRNVLGAAAGGFREFAAEARARGLIMSDADIKAADAFGDAMAAVWKQIKMVAFAIGSAFGPTIMGLTNAMSIAVTAVREFIDANRWIIVVLGLVAADAIQTGVKWFLYATVVKLVASAIGVLTLALKGLRLMWIAWKAIVLVSIAGLTLLKLAIAATVVGFAALKLSLFATKVAMAATTVTAAAMWAAIGGPAAAILIGLAGIAGAMLHFSGALRGTGAAFSEMGGTFQTAWGGIRDALSSGDLQGALEVAVAGLKVVWLQLTAYLKGVWREFSTWFQETFGNVIAGFLAAETAILRLRGEGGPNAAERAAQMGRDTQRMDDLRRRARLETVSEAFNVPFREAHRNFSDRQLVEFLDSVELLGVAQQRYDELLRAENLHPSQQSGAVGRIQAIERTIAALSAPGTGNVAAAAADRSAIETALTELNDLIRTQQEQRERPGAFAHLRSVAGRGGIGELPDLRTEATGTFSAAAVAGLGLGSTVPDLLREGNRLTEETNSELAALRSEVGGVAIA